MTWNFLYFWYTWIYLLPVWFTNLLILSSRFRKITNVILCREGHPRDDFARRAYGCAKSILRSRGSRDSYLAFSLSLSLSLSPSRSSQGTRTRDWKGIRTRSRADIIERTAPCACTSVRGLTWSRTTVARGPSFFPLNFFDASLWAASLFTG